MSWQQIPGFGSSSRPFGAEPKPREWGSWRERSPPSATSSHSSRGSKRRTSSPPPTLRGAVGGFGGNGGIGGKGGFKGMGSGHNGAQSSDKKGRFEMPSSAFDCPICFEPMTGHIFQCNEGHPICGECLRKTKARHGNCPSCRGTFPTKDMRNRGMEQLTEHVSFDCRFGCGTTWRPSELSRHVRNCKFRQVKCPVKDCSCKCTLFDLQKHLEDRHDHVLMFSQF
ncbi:unnamed protein product [Polarella glacialis]|uniref:RING-type domain-containing protein n=1 Tax=Polarella glacialis TaxID=89957 RepID=A0A813DEE5_POLGL|nr:unnamed protein product [Polarella glacialis]